MLAQFFPDQPRALHEMRRVVRDSGRVALSERTPGANEFVRALDDVLGPEASRIKRGEHAFADPAQLEKLLCDAFDRLTPKQQKRVDEWWRRREEEKEERRKE